jgi:hypothetical protein
MISSLQLIYKLQLQSKLLAKSLNLPPKFGDELLARGIYNFSNFKDVCEHIELNTVEDYYQLIFSKENAKYLMINEIEDAFIIEELHEEIESMTTRLESLTIINISKNQLISNIYELFGLEDESKYIINAENIEMNWQPCFESLQDQQAVLSSDLLINDIPFRLIATKVEFDEYSVDNFKQSLNINLDQIDESSINYRKEKSQINEHSCWLVDTVDCLSSIESSNPDEHPYFYKINNKKYLAYGFHLSPHLQVKSVDECNNINIQIKNTAEKQIFILNVESEKLVFECLFLNKIEESEKNYSPKNQWINDTVLSRDDAGNFPIVFNKSYYLMVIRPYSAMDYIENAL